MNTFDLKLKLKKRIEKFLKEKKITFQVSFDEKFHHRSGNTPNGKIFRFNLFSSKENKNIAHYAFLPMKLTFGNKTLLGGQSSNVWVDKDYQRKGLSSYLISESLSYLKKKEYSFHYGFPNEKMFRIWTNSINVDVVGVGDFMVKANKIENLLKKKKIHIHHGINNIFNLILQNLYKLNFFLKKKKSFQIQNVNFFTSEIDDFIDKNIDKSLLRFNKNFEELNWRYNDKRYKIFIIKSEETGKICGYLVSTLQKKEGINVATIIDFLLQKNFEDEILPVLLESFENFYKNCDMYCYLCMPNQTEKKFLKKYLYFSLNTSTLKRSFWMFFQPLRKINLDLKNLAWSITFFDSTDTF